MLCQAKGATSGLMPSRLCPSTLERVVRSFIVFKEWGVISLWTILRLVGIKVKLEVSSTFWFQLI